MNIANTLITDVLVMGGGGAGLRAALAAAEGGSQVIVTNKGPVTKSGITLTAAGGMQAPFHADDSPEHYFQDTVKFGYGLGDKNLARALASDACARALDAERYGARFVRNDEGHFALGQFPGQTRPRNLFIKGGGLGLVSSLARACNEHSNITLVDDFFVTGLLRGRHAGETVITGALGFSLKTGDLLQIHAKAVVMATGGCQWLWEVNDCPTDATGDGVIYAYRAGAELVDMEMVLFYPSVIVWPPSLKGAFVHYEFLASDKLDGNIYDKEGNPVLPKPLPVRDEAMRLLERAIRSGRGGAHGGLWWYVGDSSKGTEAIQKTLNTAQYRYIKTHGVDPATAKVEVAPGAHYLMGGIHINEHCQTSLKGLFATPECAGNFDGANRLAGSGITATQVFGARAGWYAHQWAAANQHLEVDSASLEEERWRIIGRLAKGDHSRSSVQRLRARLRTAVQLHAGVTRDEAGLSRLLQIAAEVQEELALETAPVIPNYNQQLVELLETDIMCEAAKIVAGSALMRRESRGHHFRADFPVQDGAKWLKHTLTVKTDKGPAFGSKPVL